MSANISHDRPLSAADALREDKLSRSGFAATAVGALRQVSSQSGFVLSVEGEWGSGKTSTLALMEALLADKAKSQIAPVIVHFNPWLVGDRDALLRQFLNAITAQLDIVDNAGVGQRVAKELKAYGKLFDVLKLIPGAEPWATIVKAVSDVFLKVGEAVGAVSEHKALDLQGRKHLVSDALREFERPIIVFIDDIDRLFPAEVFEMVRIVKAVGDLPNVGYVLAWDASYVSDALKAANVPQASSYLDKIVQVRLPLPKLSIAAKGRLVDEALNALNPEAHVRHFKDDDNRLSSLYFSGLRDVLEQPRDVMRVFNTVSLLEPGLRGEISLADIVGLATLMVKAPAVYELLKKNPQYFVGRMPGDNSLLTKSDEVVKLGDTERDDALKACAAPDAVRRVLHFLFPSVAKADKGHAVDRVEAVEGHIASPHRLLVALQHSVSPLDVSLVSARRYLSDSAARDGIALALTPDNCLDFLGALEDVVKATQGAGVDGPGVLCLAIARLVETAPFVQASERRVSFFSTNPAGLAKSTINTVIEARCADQVEPVWDTIARDSVALSLAAEVITDRRNQALNEHKPEHGDLSGLPVADDIDAFAENLLCAARDGYLFKGLTPGYLLWRMADWKPVACKPVLNAMLASDPSLDKFVVEFLSHSYDSVKGQTYSLPDEIERLEAFLPLEDLRERARQRLDDSQIAYPLKAAWRAVLEGKKLYAVDGSEARR